MHPRTLLALGAAALLSASCTSTSTPKPPIVAAEVGEIRPGLVNGYLKRSELPDSLALLPPPPAEGSSALAADGEAYRALTALQKGPRGAQAAKDANLRPPAVTSHFACALGVSISEQNTPHLNMLLRRTLADAGLATYKAKDHYNRTRPFVAFNEQSCTPAEEAALRKDGSYPSGHSALGWAWALVLTELAPERTDVLLQRGRSYIQSRGVCGVHWKSDIEAGRLIGSATVARLHDNEVFRAQLAAAKQEIAKARSAGQVPPAADCNAEAAALATSVKLAP
ncbi:acid phosphatase [Ottowia thiooxydans]|uniref:acid phosphatase n=1 Tax=Ottowia thiooxydans TaxID=219182 RepID=UPI00041813D6|nr:phosphatase PAP2 family protein [Ottowia thiooxydans]